MQREIHRAEFSDRRPIVIVGQPGRKSPRDRSYRQRQHCRSGSRNSSSAASPRESRRPSSSISRIGPWETGRLPGRSSATKKCPRTDFCLPAIRQRDPDRANESHFPDRTSRGIAARILYVGEAISSRRRTGNVEIAQHHGSGMLNRLAHLPVGAKSAKDTSIRGIAANTANRVPRFMKPSLIARSSDPGSTRVWRRGSGRIRRWSGIPGGHAALALA